MAVNRKLNTEAETPNAQLRRFVWATSLIPIIFFIGFGIYTYDWHDISLLCDPIDDPINNMFGVVGAWITFYGFHIWGIGYALLPILGVFTVVQLYRFAQPKPFVFIASLLSVTIATSSLCQFYKESMTVWLDMLNIAPNAGGAVGWLLADSLEQWVNPVGTALILWPYFIVSLIWLIGLRRIIAWISHLFTPHVLPVDEGTQRIEEEEARALLRNAANHGRDAPPKPKKVGGLWQRLFNREHVRIERQERHAEDTELELWQQDMPNEVSHSTPRSARLTDAPIKRETGSQSVRRTPSSTTTGAFLATHAATQDPVAPQFTLSSDGPDVLMPLSTASITDPTPIAKGEAKIVFKRYKAPTSNLLDPLVKGNKADAGDTHEAAETIVSTLGLFGIPVTVEAIISGPVVTQYELKPDDSVKIERIVSYTKTLRMRLCAKTMRILAPIPGKPYVGIEVPNRVSRPVVLRELLEGKTWKHATEKMALPMALGKDVIGGDLVADLARLPHLLVAGSTGSGKSVGLNSILAGLLMCRTPDQMRLILVDPKEVEFTAYEDLPHLLVPVVTDPKRVVFALRWILIEMSRRYKVLKRSGCRNIADYNVKATQPNTPDEPLPYIVVVIDELADLMLQVKADIEPQITRITQLARAAGIHMIVATQRPVVDVITGTIKSNIPGRLAFKVSQGNDSRTILDEKGAEDLIGRGDMLFKQAGANIIRSQGCWVSDDEILRITNHIKQQSGPAYDPVFATRIEAIQEDKDEDSLEIAFLEVSGKKAQQEAAAQLKPLEDDKSDEACYVKALELIRNTGRFSTSYMQRAYKIGYNKAGRITDMLEERGVIGPNRGSGARELLVIPDELVIPNEDPIVLPNNDNMDYQAESLDDDDALLDDELDVDALATDFDQNDLSDESDGAIPKD